MIMVRPPFSGEKWASREDSERTPEIFEYMFDSGRKRMGLRFRGLWFFFRKCPSVLLMHMRCGHPPAFIAYWRFSIDLDRVPQYSLLPPKARFS
jgi:hypothetical protein